MITIGDKQYRNLQEQVLKNQEDIKYILEEQGVLNQFGIKVVGQVEDEGQLPSPDTYDGEFGDAFAVGEEAPYTLYIWTRAFSGNVQSFWFNIGVFPAPSTVPGPIGPQGIEGPQGKRGSLWYSQTGAPTNTQGVNNNDQAIDGSNGNIYQFSGVWQLVGNIRGPQGIQGIQGEQGEQGIQGIQGIQGPKGDPASPVEIYGELENSNQLPMPDSVPRYAAYLIPDAAGDQHIWLQIGEGTSTNPIIWHDAGKFSNNGTTITIDGINQASVELGYVPKISQTIQIGDDTRVTSNGSEITFSNLEATGYNVNNEEIVGQTTIELPIANSGDVQFTTGTGNSTIYANLKDSIKVDIANAKAGNPKYVQILAPETATSGQLGITDMTTLMGNDLTGNYNNYIVFNKEKYYFQDNQHESGYLIYSHLGYDNTTQTYKIKCITITVSTRGWVLSEREVIDPENIYLKDEEIPQAGIGGALFISASSSNITVDNTAKKIIIALSIPELIGKTVLPNGYEFTLGLNYTTRMYQYPGYDIVLNINNGQFTGNLYGEGVWSYNARRYMDVKVIYSASSTFSFISTYSSAEVEGVYGFSTSLATVNIHAKGYPSASAAQTILAGRYYQKILVATGAYWTSTSSTTPLPIVAARVESVSGTTVTMTVYYLNAGTVSTATLSLTSGAFTQY